MKTRRPARGRDHRPLTAAKKIERALKRIPILILCGLVLFALFLTARKIARPVIFYYRDSREISQYERERDKILEENARMRARCDYLRTPEGAQTEARKLGYVRPGEVSIVLEEKSPAETER